MLSENEEEYLEEIYSLSEDREKISISRISEAMGVSKASTSEMISKLSEKKLLKHERYGEIELTEEGMNIARNIKRRHRLLESFLHFLGKRDVHNEACKLEHGISEESADAICRFLGAPERCPDDGKEIPRCGKDCSECLKKTLADISTGKETVIFRTLCGKKASMRLNELGLLPGEKIKVVNRMAHGPIEVEVKGTKVAIGYGLAKKILVEECE
ncbi:MAG: metal-dependent transcriptional regulator [Candidatus Thermoplasmatota archaeon]|nr:metal-dependent transcriptional regulator [Candidatus Thermoplasmatota archaeon]